MKVLSDCNYIIRKVITHQTQCVHRMRIRLFKPDYHKDNIEVILSRLYPDGERVEDSDIFDNNIPEQKQALDENGTTHTRETPAFPHKERQVRRYDLKRDRPLNRSPQRLSLTPDFEISIDCESSPPPHVRIDEQPELINSPPNDENLIDLRPTDNSSETQYSEPTPPNEDQHTSPPKTSRNNTSRYGLRSNPTPKTYPDFLIHDINNARKILR